MDTITVVSKGTGDGQVSVRFGTLDSFDEIDAESALQCLLQLWISARLFPEISPENNEVGVPEYDVRMGMVFDSDNHVCRFRFRGEKNVFCHQCSIDEVDLIRAIDQLFLQPRRANLPVKEVHLDFSIYHRQRSGSPDTYGPHVVQYEDRHE